MLSNYKKQFQPAIAIIARPFLSWNPSILTLLGTASSVLFFLGIISHVYVLSILSLLGFVFDALDGYVARTSHRVSAFGGFLDSTCDRVSDFFFIVSFGFSHLVPWGLVICVLFTSYLISYMRARADAALGKDQEVGYGLMQRTERLIFVIAGFFLFLLFHQTRILTTVFGLLLLLNCITVIQRFMAFRNLSQL